MRTGTLKFNTLQLDAFGTPSLKIQRTRQPASGERPSFFETRYSVSIEIDSLAPSTSRAKITAIKEGLDTNEGLLTLSDENGYDQSWLVKPISDNIGDILKNGHGTMEINFSGNEAVNKGNAAQDAQFVPSSGAATIDIHRIETWKEDVKTTRKDERVGTRSLTTSTITFSGRTVWADLNLDYDSRMAWLDAQRQTIKGMDTKEGVLTRPGFSETVQVESITIKIGGNAEFLMLDFQCRYTKLPGDTVAEADFNVSDETDFPNGKITRRLQGSIEAPDEVTAKAKLDALATAYQTAGYRRRKINIKPSYLDGHDQATSTPAMIRYEFSVEYDQWFYTIWKLNIDTEKNPSGNKMTYSGTVTSVSESLALDKAQEIGNDLLSPHPVMLSSKETVKAAADPIQFTDGETTLDPDLNTQEFIEVSFNYVYAVANDELYANITQQINKPAFGDYTTSISGEITAVDEPTAETAARAYIPLGTCLRENSETSTSTTHATDTQWTKLSFNYGWHNEHTETTFKYSDSLSIDYKSMTAMRTISGTVRAIGSTEAATAIDTLLGNPLPNNGVLINKNVNNHREACGLAPGDSFIQADFTLTIEEDVTGTIGNDIMDATLQLDRIGQVQHDPIIAVPCGKPVKQNMPGSYTIGQLTISGSCTARQEATAVAWGQANRDTVMTFGDAAKRAERKPRETKKANYPSLNGTTPKSYTFSFSYSAEFTDGLIGIWPVDELNLTPSP